ncbi:MAG: hypothetical protein LBM96_01955, partial [Methanobrevibacter sp.]|nr:hypothetical protein [Candidatus Methanoflexus mossambicus]
MVKTNRILGILGIFVFVFLALLMVSSVSAASDVSITNTTSGGIKGAYDQLDSTGGTIHLSDGVYSGANNTNLIFSKNLTMIGASRENTIIDARGLNGILNISRGSRITIENISFINGAKRDGAAICNYADNLNIINCNFINNTNVHTTISSNINHAGAIYNWANNTKIINSYFVNNSAGNLSSMGDGGAIYNEIGYNFMIINSYFVNNSATGNGASAICNAFGDNFGIINSSFINNSCHRGPQDGSTGTILNPMGVNFSIINCSFKVAMDDISNEVIVNRGVNFTIIDSDFTSLGHNNTLRGISNSGDNLNIINSSFVNFVTTVSGGSAIDNYGYNFKIINSSFVNNFGSNAIICNYRDNLTIIGCNFSNNYINVSAGSIIGFSGVISNNAANLLIINSSFANNYVRSNGFTYGYCGGAIFNTGVNFNVSYSSFVNNSALYNVSCGGAIFNTGNNFSVSDSVFISNVANNSFTSYGRGAIYTKGNNSKIINSNFTNNYASSGGAIFYDGDSNSANFSVVGCSFVNNYASNGGAILVEDLINFTVINSSFVNNSAGGVGGAVANYNGVNFSFIACSFVNNTGNKTVNTFFNSNITNSSFENCNFITNASGVMFYNNGCNTFIINSNFTNGNIYNYGNNIFVSNSTFIFSIFYALGDNNSTLLNSNFINRSAFNIHSDNSFISNCVVINGSLLNVDGDNSSIVNCSFSNYRSTDLVFEASYGVNITINDCSFINVTNGLELYNTKNTRILNSNFINIYSTYANAVPHGTAIWLYNKVVGVDVVNCSFINVSTNSSNTNYHGTIYLDSGCNISIINSTFINNSILDPNQYGEDIHSGGVVYIESKSNASIMNSIFINSSILSNSEYRGKYNYGGVVYIGSNSNVGIMNSSFINTSVFSIHETAYGGAIFNNGNLTLINSSFINNSLIYTGGYEVYNISYGGAIFNNGSLFLSKNIMNGNSAKYGNVIYNNGSIGVLNGSFINDTFNTLSLHPVTLFINLTDDMGNTITGGNVSFFVDGLLIGNATVNEGIAKLNYNPSSAGTFILSLDYSGNNGFDLNVRNGTLIVEEYVPPNYSSGIFVNSSKNDGSFSGNSWENATQSLAAALEIIVNNDLANVVVHIAGNANKYIGSGNNVNLTLDSNFDNITLSGEFGSPIFDGERSKNPNIQAMLTINANNVKITNITFINGNNYLNYMGGAIYNMGNNCSVVNCSFVNNSIRNYYGEGGAIRNTGQNFTLSCSEFIFNGASMYGGAVYNSADGFSVVNCSFYNDSAYYGGAISNSGSGFIVNCSFLNNTVISNSGGAVYNTGSNLSIINSTFIRNNASTSSSHGGAIYNSAGNCSVVSSTFINNSASNGNGGAILNDVRGNMNVVGSSFVNNSAKGYGGVINNNGNLSLSNNVMYGANKAAHGKLIYNNGSIGVLSLVYLNNATFYGYVGLNSLLIASLTDDMGNLVSGGTVTFLLDGVSLGTATVYDGITNLTYTPSSTGTFILSGNYSGHNGFDIDVRNGPLVVGDYVSPDYSFGVFVNSSKIDGAFDGSNWNNAVQSLSDVLNIIVRNGLTNVVVHIAGDLSTMAKNYTGSNRNRNLNLNHSFDNITLLGEFGSPVFDSEGSSLILNIDANNVTIRNMVFQHVWYSYGAIYNKGRDLSIFNCSFINNRATSNGGAIYDSGVNLKIFNCSFVDNSAIYSSSSSSAYGGAIYMGSNCSVVNSIFVNNYADMGGAFYVSGDNCILVNSSFVGHYAKVGGVIYDRYGDNFRVVNCSFVGNHANSDDGGVIYNRDCNNFSVVNCSFVDNYAKNNEGGVIYNTGSMFSVVGSSFVNNSVASTAGAIFAGGSNANVMDCSFVNNSVTGNGGVIFVSSGGDNLRIINSSFVNNSANDMGGAVYTSSSGGNYLTIINSSFIHNVAVNEGGAIKTNAKNALITNSTFKDNGYASESTMNTFVGGAICNAGINSNITYNRFVNNSAANSKAIYSVGSGSNLNSNWYGSNDITGMVSGLDYVLNDYFVVLVSYSPSNNYLNSTDDNIAVDVDSYSLIYYFALNTSTSTNILNNTVSNLPAFNISIVLSNGSIIIMPVHDSYYITDPVTIPKGDSAYIRVLADNEDLKLLLGMSAPDYSNGVFVNSSKTDGAFDGSSWENAVCNLSAALNVILGNSLTNVVVHIAGDVYTLAHNYTGVANTGLTLDSRFNNITLSGEFGSPIFDGKRSNLILNITANNVTIKNILFKNGKTTSYGGAIYNSGDDFSVVNSSFVNNSAYAGGAINNRGNNFCLANSSFINNHAEANANMAYGGGAVQNTGMNGSIIGSEFVNNSANSYGGAVHNNGGKTFHISDSTFVNNYGGNVDGGAVYNNGSNCIVLNSSFVNNSVTKCGGAVFNHGVNFSVVNSSFVNNSAIGDSGGAISNWVGDNLIVANCNFVNNSAKNVYWGGAIYNSAGNNFRVMNSTFVNNFAFEYAGSIYNNNGINFNIINSSFVNNTANSNGGGIYNTGANFNIINSSFEDNSASSGGAIYNNGINLNIINNSFINNIALVGGGIYNSGAGLRVSNSSFDNNSAVASRTRATGAGSGGAIYNSGAVDTKIDNSSFSNNSAIAGGAIYNGEDSDLDIHSNSFVDNSVSGENSGIVYNAGNLSLSKNTMVDNEASTGKTIYNDGNIGVLNLTYSQDSSIPVLAGNDVTLLATLTDDMGNDITGGTVSFHVEGVPVGSDSIVNGQATYVYTTDETGVFEISGGYAKSEGFTTNIVPDELPVVDYTHGVYVNSSKTDGMFTGDNWTNAVCNLTHALEIFNQFQGNISDRIIHIAGSGIGGAKDYTGIDSNINLTISISNIIIQGEFGSPVFNGENKDIHIFRLSGYNMQLKNITLINSNFTGSYAGGAIYSSSRNLTIDGCIFANNSASGDTGAGGAIVYFNYDLHIINSIFINNSASFVNDAGKSTGIGGAIYTSDAQKVDIQNSTFIDNSAGRGGAIFAQRTILNITNSIFNHNFVDYNNVSDNRGGAIYTYNATSYLTDSNFINNYGYQGGSLYLYLNRSYIKNSNFTSNFATYFGGAINNNNAELEIKGSNFINNTNYPLIDGVFVNYDNGGPGNAIYTDSYSATIINTTFANNHGKGGALDSYNNLEVDSCIFLDNMGNSAGYAIDSSGGWLVVKNTIVKNNHQNFTLENRSYGAINGFMLSYANFTNCSFINNSAARGGAIALLRVNISNIDNCSFIDNFVVNAPESNSGSGGAIYCEKDSPYNEDKSFSRYLNIKNSIFVNNYNLNGVSYIGGGNGGAIYNEDLCLNITNCNFTNNSNINGGAIYTMGNNTIISNSIFVNNSVYINGGLGGAIYNSGDNFSVVNSSFTNHFINITGSAIWNNGDNTFIFNSTFNGSCNNPDFKSTTYSIPSISIYNAGDNFNFINCTCTDFNTTIHWQGNIILNEGNNTKIINSSFFNNENYNSIYNHAADVSVVNCSFVNDRISSSNSNNKCGGAIWNNGLNLNIRDSIFVNTYTFDDAGAAIHNVGGHNCSIVNCTFINNYAALAGSGIYNSYANELSVVNSTFIGNSNGNLGVIWNNGNNSKIVNSIVINSSSRQAVIYNDANNLTIINSSFINNSISGSGTNGGVINNNGGSGLMIINSSFINNSAKNGGYGAAIFNIGSDLMIINSSFNNNLAGSVGGAIYNTGANSGVFNSSFVNNSVNNYGGAIWNRGNNFKLVNSILINNSAVEWGGAFYTSSSGGLNFNIINSSFINNSAGGAGGAIYSNSNNSFISNSTFTGNTYIEGKDVNTFNGSAIYNAGNNLSLRNNKFIDNVGGIGTIYNSNNLSLSNNAMIGNTATLGQMIYNAGTIGVLNLTYMGNKTVNVKPGSSVVLNATLTDDMGNTVTGENITFFVNGTAIGNVTAIEGIATLNYNANTAGIVPVSGDYEGHNGFPINNLIGLLDINLDLTAGLFVNSSKTTGNFDGSDWDNAVCNLTAALSIIRDKSLNNTVIHIAGAGIGGAKNYTDIGVNINLELFINNITLSGEFGSPIFDAQGLSHMFKITASNVTIANITFINGKVVTNHDFHPSIHGGAISNSGNNLKIINSVFINNSVGDSYGTAIYNIGNNFLLINSSFSNNSWNWTGKSNIQDYRGGDSAIYNAYSSNFTVINSNFYNNSADIYNVNCSNFSIFNSNFDACNNGIPIFNLLVNKSITISNCSFINNRVNAEAVSIYNLNSSNCTIVNSKFINNSGSSIIHNEYGPNLHVINCSFSNLSNSGMADGNAIDNSYSPYLNVLNCSFNNISSTSLSTTIENSLSDNFTIRNSIFINCHQGQSGAIRNSGNNFNVFECVFVDNSVTSNYGGAIHTTGKNIRIIDSNFTNNSCSNSAWGGGAIYIEGSNGGSDNFIIENCIFVNNSAANGGAIYNDEGNNGSIINSTFSYNRANCSVSIDINPWMHASGGSAIANAGSAYNLSVVDCIFFNNTIRTGTSEGTIYNFINASCSIVNSSFVNNYGRYGGGVANHGNCSILNSSFLNNSVYNNGGAILNYGNLTIINPTLVNNSAGRGGSGGAIYNAADNFVLMNIEFINNSAKYGSGGGFNNVGDNVIVKNCTFINCSGSFGGGARNYGFNFRIMDCIFLNNSVTSYGGAFTNDGLDYDDSGNNCSIINCTFINNSATAGGAIYNGRNNNTDIMNCSFVNTHAVDVGGVIYNYYTNNFRVMNSSFLNSSAEDIGGVIYNQNSNYTSIMNCSFNESNAYNGGAIFNNCNYTSIINCSFVNTYADGGAGVIYNSGGNNLTIMESIFINNSVGFECSGGVIYAIGNNLKILYSVFINNSAETGSGGVMSNRGDDTLIMNSIFINNTAIKGGAILTSASGGVNLTIINSSFINNSANYGGGVFTNTNNTVILDSNFTGNTQAIGIDRTNSYIFSGNKIFDNDVGIQFVYTDTVIKDHTVLIEELKINNSGFKDNNYSFAISGINSSYTFIGNGFNDSYKGFLIFENGSGNILKDSQIHGLNVTAITFGVSSNKDGLNNVTLFNNLRAILVLGDNINIISSNIYDNTVAINLTSDAVSTHINFNRIVNNSVILNGMDIGGLGGIAGFGGIAGGLGGYAIYGADSNDNLTSNWWGQNLNITDFIEGNNYKLDDYFVLLLSYANISGDRIYIGKSDKEIMVLGDNSYYLYFNLALNTSTIDNILNETAKYLPNFNITLIFDNGTQESNDSEDDPNGDNNRTNDGNGVETSFVISLGNGGNNSYISPLTYTYDELLILSALGDNENISLTLNPYLDKDDIYSDGVYVNSSIEVSGDGRDWEHAFSNLKDALDCVIRNSLNDESDDPVVIHIAGDLSTLANNYTGDKNVALIFDSNLGNITLSGEFGSPIFDAQGSSYIFNIHAGADNIKIANMTFINGHTDGDGGAISNNANNLNIINSSFINNSANSSAGAYGGAIYNNNGTNFSVSNSSFINNSA